MEDAAFLQEVLLQLFVLVSFAMAAAVVCRLLKIPTVVGEIIVGIIIGNTLMFGALKLDTDTQVFEVFKNLGVIFLLFAVGLETPFSELRKVGKTAFIVASLGVLFPFIGGYIFMVTLGYDSLVAMFVGAAMVATSVGITARVIRDMGLGDTIEARVIIGAAVIDDVLGLMVLTVVQGIAGGSGNDVVQTALVAIEAVVFVLAVMFIGGIAIPKIRSKRKNNSSPMDHMPSKEGESLFSPLPIALVLCFALSYMAQLLNLAAIVGAFLAGMAFAEFRDRWPCEDKFQPINEFLVPFFFLFIGINVDLGSFNDSKIIMIGVVLTVIAIITKIIGCGLGSKSLGGKSAMVVGVGMAPRGEVGLIVASIGLSMSIVTADIYAVVVFMCLATTLAAPPMLSAAFRSKFKHKDRHAANANADDEIRIRNR